MVSSIYKRRSTGGEPTVALTDTIYDKVRSSFFPAAIRFDREEQRLIYVITLLAFRSSTLFSLSKTFLPTKTDFLPTREGF